MPKSDKPVPRDIPKEPAQTKERRVTLTEEWPLPAVVVAHHITFDGNPDSYPLHIASKILSDGQSSRIYRKLVYEKRHRAGGVRRRQHHRGSEPVLRGGDRPAGSYDRGGDQGADRRARQAARASRSPPRELQQAKNQFARDYILGRESNQNKAEQLGHAAVIHNDIKTADGEFDIFQNITAADVQRVAQHLLHAGEPDGDHDPAEGRDQVMATHRALVAALARDLALAAVPFLRSAQSKNWPTERPPRPLAARDVKFPPYAFKTLANGLQVIAVSHHEQPAVSLRLIVRAGAAQDPENKPGRGRARGHAARPGDDHAQRRADRQRHRLDRRRDRHRRRHRT